jgi:hypothetical protein
MMWVMHDGASAHFSTDAWENVDAASLSGGPIFWPVRFRDIPPLVFIAGVGSNYSYARLQWSEEKTDAGFEQHLIKYDRHVVFASECESQSVSLRVVELSGGRHFKKLLQ